MQNDYHNELGYIACDTTNWENSLIDRDFKKGQYTEIWIDEYQYIEGADEEWRRQMDKE